MREFKDFIRRYVIMVFEGCGVYFVGYNVILGRNNIRKGTEV